MNHSGTSDPFLVLGLSRDAGEAEIRARYLELVKQYPPEREPEKFQAVRAAYDAVKDPLLIAQHLLEPPDEDMPQWSAVLEVQKKNPPRLSLAFLLSLGNRASDDRTTSPQPPQNGEPQPATSSNETNVQ